MNELDNLVVTKSKASTKISFDDSFKQECILQINSSFLENKILFGIERDINGNIVNARMNLTQEQVSILLPYLQKFAKTDELL